MVGAQWGDFSFNGSINYVDSYKDERGASGPTIKDQATIDVNAIWSIRGGKTKLFAQINSLTDENPPLAPLDISYDPYTHSPLGRSAKIGVSYQF